MPLILQREKVLEVYAEAANRKWVLPAFNAENLTTCEAILAAACEYGDQIGVANLPIIIGITNNYRPRPQATFYTHTSQWHLGMKLFLKDLQVLTSEESPYANLKVMIHLDHIQWDTDQQLLDWDMSLFSSIMYDASTLPFEQNIKKTAAFRKKYGNVILIEGACDEVGIVSKEENDNLTKPDDAAQFLQETGVDIIVANLGTEHRAAAANVRYNSELAREISERIGSCLCLHGTSSVPLEHLTNLFNDGVRRVNIWTALERDSSVALFQNMIKNAAKIIGHENAKKLCTENMLGYNADCDSKASINYYTTKYRQDIIFQNMKKIVKRYLRTFYQ